MCRRERQENGESIGNSRTGMVIKEEMAYAILLSLVGSEMYIRDRFAAKLVWSSKRSWAQVRREACCGA